MKNKEGLPKLVAIMQRLRGPKGCPWDKEQTMESLIPFIVEEAYEVIGAIDAKSPEMLKEELGDLLFQIIFMCQLAREKGDFDIEDVMALSAEKMIRRHPHVFGKTKAKTSKDVLKHWSRIKKQEKDGKKRKGYLSDIPEHLPALLKAHKVTEKAAEAGFDWSDIKEVFEKVEEEIAEFKAELKKGNIQRMEAEFGDLIFALVNVGRFIEINPEEALRKTIARFITRFHYIEDKLIKKGKALNNASIEEMENFWKEAKLKEKNQALQALKTISPQHVDN
ncbi:MAG TPA: nucleoside triphosphate pyrophosphohydrolase [Thermodesulfobacteriota bacterium]|nr:nucleoside triphosphate pyrophosphohydrolase [Thermodesulfobacteriota bacterium]